MDCSCYIMFACPLGLVTEHGVCVYYSIYKSCMIVLAKE